MDGDTIRPWEDLQSTEKENTTETELLRPALVEMQDIRYWENQQRPVCDDVRNGIADEECIYVHLASWVHAFVPEPLDGTTLEYCGDDLQSALRQLKKSEPSCCGCY